MKSLSLGVIVARFQVHKLTAAHVALVKAVQAKHERVAIFLGTPAHKALSKQYPLPFEARYNMVRSAFPDVMILPIQDTRTNEEWSKSLDRKISEICEGPCSITLYGGRKSFIPQYKGKFQCEKLELPVNEDVSGTDSRNRVSSKVLTSEDFRAGIIWAIYNSWPSPIPTVDVAPLHWLNDKLMIGLGKRETEGNWRFIGGHAESCYATYEKDAHEEAYQESGGLDVISLEYVGSTIVNDYRWEKEPNSIKTILFTGFTCTMEGRGSDDIDAFRWFDFTALTENQFVSEHRPLFKMLKSHLEKKYDKLVQRPQPSIASSSKN